MERVKVLELVRFFIESREKKSRQRVRLEEAKTFGLISRTII